MIEELIFGPNDPSKIVECSANSTCTTVHAIASALIVFAVLLTGFAYTTLLERRLIASIQSRIGPNRAGPKGLLQPVADAIKLIFKEDVIPAGADRVVYTFAPILKIVPSLIVLAVVPLGPKVLIPWTDDHWYRVNQGIVDVNIGVLWLLAVMSISVYGVTLAGWASNNKYSMLGALRSAASMVSYELSMGLAFAVPIMLAGSMSIGDIVNSQQGLLNWFIFQNPLAAIILGIALLAEINRGPFDMPEAEQELVAGHMTEYGGMKFAAFFMAEYTNMIGVSVIFSSMFLGGYDDGFGLVRGAPLLGLPVLAVKVFLLLSLMIWVRGTVFRPRYDRLMTFGWKVLLPLSMLAVTWTAVSIVIADEGGDTAYLISIVALFVVVFGIGILLSRQEKAATLNPLEDGGVMASGQSVGYLALQLVGAVLAIPLVLFDALRSARSSRRVEEDAKAKT
jgi:NADH-quinone oxidoreductase subunit H